MFLYRKVNVRRQFRNRIDGNGLHVVLIWYAILTRNFLILFLESIVADILQNRIRTKSRKQFNLVHVRAGFVPDTVYASIGRNPPPSKCQQH